MTRAEGHVRSANLEGGSAGLQPGRRPLRFARQISYTTFGNTSGLLGKLTCAAPESYPRHGMSLTPEERDALRDRLRQFRSGEPVRSPSEPAPAEPEAAPPPPAPLAPSVPDAPSAAASENLLKCRACQHSVARDAKRCPSCGTENPWRSQAEIDKEKKVLQGCLLGCLGVIGLLMILGMFALMTTPPGSSRSSPDRRLTDSTECQAIAMQETGLLDGPLVDAAHERCMAARGYRKK